MRPRCDPKDAAVRVGGGLQHRPGHGAWMQPLEAHAVPRPRFPPPAGFLRKGARRAQRVIGLQRTGQPGDGNRGEHAGRPTDMVCVFMRNDQTVQ